MIIIPGLYARYKGSWGYIVSVGETTVMLSGWRGIKTTIADIKDITEVKDRYA